MGDYALPLGLGVLALVGGGLFLALRSRKGKQRKTAAFAPPAPPTPASPPVKPARSGSAGASARLGDSATATALPAVAAAAAAPLSMDSTQQLTQPMYAATQGFGNTAALDQTMVIEPVQASALHKAAQSPGSARNEGFDQTAQIHVETAHINLQDNDPLAEADFHLAYGLYDEAILLLRNTLNQQPGRTDVEVKLAETLFAAGRAIEFQDLAEGLKPKLDAGEWSKIAIMGAQICPDAGLFKDGDGELGLATDFDLAFDEPAAPAPAPTPAAVEKGNSIDFALEAPLDFSLQVPAPAPSPAPLPPQGLDDNASIDFMLGQSLTPLGATGSVSSPAPSAALDFDLPRIEKPMLSADPLGLSDFNDNPTITPGGRALVLSLQDLEVSITPRDSAVSVDDEMNTKLDLARAYVEMGDNDMAKSLLNEVQQQGSDQHRQEAQSLLQRLPA
jgi:FimV-like protein